MDEHDEYELLLDEVIKLLRNNFGQFLTQTPYNENMFYGMPAKDLIWLIGGKR